MFDDCRCFTIGSPPLNPLTRFTHCCPLTLVTAAASMTAFVGFASLFTMLVLNSFCIEVGYLFTSFGRLRSHAGLCRRHPTVQLLQDSHVRACRSSDRPRLTGILCLLLSLAALTVVKLESRCALCRVREAMSEQVFSTLMTSTPTAFTS